MSADGTGAQVGDLLARLPTRDGAAPADDWLADAGRLLDRDLDDVERARLLDARSVVRSVVRPIVRDDVVAPSRPSVAAELYRDAARAAALYEDAGMGVEAAASYATAASGAAYAGHLDVALDIAVRAIASFSAVTQSEHEPRSRARLAIRLGMLCEQFFDVAAARELFAIAADGAAEAGLADLWSAATLAGAGVVEARLLDLLDPLPGPARAGLADDLDALAEALERDGDGDDVRRVDAPRLRAAAALGRGDAAGAWAHVEAAWQAATGSHLELLVTRAACLAELGRTAAALPLLDEALGSLDPGWDLGGFVTALALRSHVRRAAGDLPGAVDDLRRVAAETLGRHQQHVGGFLGQVLSRARVEGERRALVERADALARTVEADPLTGAGNRRSVERLVDELPAGAALAVAVVDLDGFKGVNDTFGHELGDRLLVELAGLLADVVADDGHVARWGGEEFVVVAPGAGEQEARTLGERVRRAVEDRTWAAGAVGLRLTVSVGVAHGAAEEASELLARADAALYAAKSGGRNRTVASGDAGPGPG